MSPTRDDIAAFVTAILVEFLDDEVGDTIDRDTPVGEDGLGVESIGILEVVVKLEREYDISLSDESIERMVSTTFGALVDEVAMHLPVTVELPVAPNEVA